MVRKIRTLETISEKYDKIAAPNSGIRMRPSIGLDQNVGEYLFVKVDSIEPYDKQARKIFDEDELMRLAETIKTYGVRQPLTVIRGERPGLYKVISGERRLRSAKIAGLEKVPCIILDQEDLAEELAVIENIQRSDLHPVELASAYASLLKDFNYGDQTKLAKKLGVTNSHLSEILALHRLSSDIKDYLLSEKITTRSALRKVVNETQLESVKEILGHEVPQTKRQNRRKFALRIYFEGDKAVLGGMQTELSSGQKQSLVAKLKNITTQLER